jgi:hypothetical protein
MRALTAALVLTLVMAALPTTVSAEPFDERPGWQRGLLWAYTPIPNVVPIVPAATVAPKCLPGYIFCKAAFAGMSLLAATAQLVASGGEDPEQTRAIVRRGFGGDWVVTPRHIVGDETADVLPEAGPRANPAPGSAPTP